MSFLLWTFIVIMFILVIYSIIIKRQNKTLTQNYTKLLSQKKSSEVRLGQISEQLAPFLDGFPYNPKETKFLGMPIDFICFEPDKVVFVEVKSGQAQLSEKQRNIRDLIKNNQVFWEEFRISGNKATLDNNQQQSDDCTLII